MTGRHPLVLSIITLVTMTLTSTASPARGLWSDGEIAVDLQNVTLTLDASFALSCSWDAFELDAAVHLTEMGPDRVALSGMASIAPFTAEVAIEFAIQTATLVSRAVTASGAFDLLQVTVHGVQERGGRGLGIEAESTEDLVVEWVALGFNLDPYGEIQTESCQLTFTYAEAEFALSCPTCAGSITGSILYDASGFVELFFSASQVGNLPLNVTLGASVLFEPDAKTLDLHPSLMLENPTCIDIYAGLSWDPAAQTLDGLQIYAIGTRCDIGDVRFCGLWTLDPTTIALVKAPYWSLLGLVWDLPGCCGDLVEGSVALFFGDENLFDLGAIEAEFVIPLSPASTVTLNASLTMDGGFTLTFGWNVGTPPSSE